jgi:dolichol kinase
LSIALDLALLAGSVALLMGVIAAVRYAGERFGWHAEVSRKTIHVAIGLYAMALPLLFDTRLPVVVLLLIALALMGWLRLPQVRTSGLGKAIHAVERRSLGDIWLALAIGFVFLQSEGEYIFYALPLAIITLSDTAAALTGSAYGRSRFAVEDGVKSWEGVVAFFMVSVIVAMAMLLLLTDAPRLNVVVLAFAIAAFGAIVEAVSWRGLDNLFVPICLQFFIKGYLFAEPMALALIALQFGVAVIAVAVIARRLALSVHASRAFVIAIFLFLGAGGPYGAVVPMFAIAAHLVARRRPCASPHRDLDFIATLCGAGLIWFFVGETIGPSALSFYNLGMAGMALGLLVVATGGRVAAGAVLTLAVGAGYIALLSLAPGHALHSPYLPLVAAASLLLVTGLVLARTPWFDRWRAPRLGAVANLVPFAAYLATLGMQ